MFRRLAKYLWAAPTTVPALLLFLPLAWMTGGSAQIVRGVVEIYSGWIAKRLNRGFVFSGPVSAMTLGHVILGADRVCLARCRDHEHVHVRQYERWGPFFLPAYLGASAILYFRGLNPYLDNPFEREAYGDDSQGA